MTAVPSPATPATTFETLALPEALRAGVAALGFTRLTPVQAASLPPALAGEDLIVQAPTGSGKTAAFGLALLAALDSSVWDVQALVLCPTRELADQVAAELRRLARAAGNVKILSLCGGTPMRPQRESLAHGAHVVVGTPGRLMDLLEVGALQLGGLQTLVFDEADRMLDMGFIDDMVTVASQCPPQRQTLLFSATYPEGIASLAARFLRKPRQLTVHAAAAKAEGEGAARIRELAFEVTDQARLHAVGQLLRHYRPASTIAFCNTKQQCRDLVDVLTAEGFVALALHGDLDQRERDQVLIRFAQRSVSVLVATDVAARGLDIEQLEAVINVDVTQDIEQHVHRIGRTGRAGHDGLALNLVSMDEMGRIGRIEQARGDKPFDWAKLAELQEAPGGPLRPAMATLQILGGKKEKIRPGDVLGALTGDAGFSGTQVGKIKVTDFHTYVAVDATIADQVVAKLGKGTLKGRKVKLRRLDEVVR